LDRRRGGPQSRSGHGGEEKYQGKRKLVLRDDYDDDDNNNDKRKQIIRKATCKEWALPEFRNKEGKRDLDLP
jgi:hypothetical protein